MRCRSVRLLVVLAGLAALGSAVNIDGELDFPEDAPSSTDGPVKSDSNVKDTFLEIDLEAAVGSKPPRVIARVWTGESRGVHKEHEGAFLPAKPLSKGWTGIHNESVLVVKSNSTKDIEIATNKISYDEEKTESTRKLIPNYDFPVVTVVKGKTPTRPPPNTTPVVHFNNVNRPYVSGHRREWYPYVYKVGVRGSQPFYDRPYTPCRRHPLPPSGAGRPRQPVGWSWRSWAPVDSYDPRPQFRVDDKLGDLSGETTQVEIDGKLGGEVEEDTAS